MYAHGDWFADQIKRIEAAKRGAFSVDQPEHRAKRAAEAAERFEIDEAYASLSLDKATEHRRIAESIPGLGSGGVWPGATGILCGRTRALDKAVLEVARRRAWPCR